MKKPVALAGAVLALIAAPPLWANSLVGAGPHPAIAHSSMAASPDGEWNKLTRVDGGNVEIWTRDGDNLNKISFFGGVPVRSALYRERDKRAAPLPKVVAGMLLPDIPVLFESTYRAQYKVNRLSIDSQEPATLNGKPAIRFAYSYVRNEDEVERKGEAIGALEGGKLYLVTYEAPAIHFFEKDLPAFRQVVSTLKF